MVGVIYVYVDKVFGFYVFCFYFCFFLLNWMLLNNMTVWTPAVLSGLYVCVL